MGFLIQEFGAFSHSKQFSTLYRPSPIRLLSHTSISKLGCSARVSSVQFGLLVLQSLYGSGKPLQLLTSIVGLLLVIYGFALLDLDGIVICLVVGSLG